MTTRLVTLRRSKFALLFATLLIACQTVNAAKPTFSVKSLKGCYVASLYGQLLPNPRDPSLQLPQSSIIRFCANGKGKGTAKARWNVAGLCILRQTGAIQYTVSSTGIGSAIAKITNTSVSGVGCTMLQPPIVKNSKGRFRFQMVLDGKDCMEVLGTELLVDPGGAKIRIPLVSQGQACKQQF